MKRLTQRNIVTYLLDRNFLTTSPLINGTFKLMNIQSRNWIFTIELGHKEGLFVKQLVKVSPLKIYLMQKDAVVHHLIHRQHFYKKLVPYVPEYYGYDPAIHVLVLKYYKNAINLKTFFYKEEQDTIPLIQKLATIFSYLHRPIQENIPNKPSLQFFNRQIPWILTLIDNHTSSKFPVFQAIHLDENLIKTLKQLSQEWESTALIHGDVKLANILIVQVDEVINVKLVDWEMADIGDPLWDIAGLIQSYLALVIRNQKENSKDKPLLLDRRFFDGFETCQKYIQEFWKTYALHQQWTKTQEQQKLVKTIYYTGARLLQTAHEMNKNVTEKMNFTQSQIVQLVKYIFKSPQQTIVDILAI